VGSQKILVSYEIFEGEKMRFIMLASLWLLFCLMPPVVSPRLEGQFFSKPEQRQESEARPFTVFGGNGLSDSQLGNEKRSNNRLFGRWDSADREEPSRNPSGGGLFSGKGMADVPFNRGGSQTSGGRWDDVDNLDSDRRPMRLFSPWNNQPNQIRSARRYEMEEKPKWFGKRPFMLQDDMEEQEPNWFERMNQKSRDFWSDSSDWMQERNQTMRTRRQETWDSLSKSWRPTPERPEFEQVPPSGNFLETPDRKGSSIDRF